MQVIDDEGVPMTSFEMLTQMLIIERQVGVRMLDLAEVGCRTENNRRGDAPAAIPSSTKAVRSRPNNDPSYPTGGLQSSQQEWEAAKCAANSAGLVSSLASHL